MTKNFKKIFSILFIYFNSVISSQSVNLRFEHLTMQEGLSSNKVNCILQDQYGFMWFGTECGIDKYDGYSFVNYGHDPKDSSSISDNLVTDIQEDKFGNLWVATNNGLNRFDPVSEKFSRFFYKQNNLKNPDGYVFSPVYIDEDDNIWFGTSQGLYKLSPSADNNKEYNSKNYKIDSTQIYSYKNVTNVIYEDSDGILWIGTMDGLYSFDRNNETFTPYVYDPENPNSISANTIISLFEDKKNNLWIGTAHAWESGSFIADRSGLLNKYNKKINQFTHYTRNEDPYYISYVSSVAEDQDGTLWFGAMENHGLYRYVNKSNQFIRYGHFQNNPYSMSSNFVTDLFIDKSGIIWIATHQGGVSKYDPNKEKFKHFEHLPGVDNTLHFDKVKSIIEDSFGKVWIGTWGNKIGFYSLKTGLFDKYERYQYYGGIPIKDTKNLSSPFIRAIIEDNSENIWIGTVIGLNKYNRTTKTYKKYFEKYGDPNNSKFISSSQVICLLQDKFGYLWIGTHNGLNRMDVEAETFKHYFNNINDSTTLSTNFIHYIHEDNDGDLWIGSFGGGVNLYDRNKDQFKRYLHNPSDKNSLSDDRVTVIADDNTGNIWIGTMMGLNKFDKQLQKFTLYTTSDGLCNNYVVGILGDEQGFLWISTKNGLSKFNPKNNTFRNYDESDGLQSSEFNKLAFHKGKSGRFYFGGNNGFNMFYPDSVKDNSFIPPVFITSIKKSNNPIKLKKSIFETKEIHLRYSENDISFSFVALNYTNSHKNQYAYQLHGYDDSWNYCGTKRFANYTNLAPGDYTFRVKGSNNDGVWNEVGASIRIIITPPWWKTNLAYFIYVLLIGFIIYLVWHFQMRRLRIRHQLEMEHLETEKYQEIDRLKSQFFANISHEFRTPLTLILSPIEQLINHNFKGNIEDSYLTIRSNAKKLLRLINQLLSLSKLEVGQLKLQVSEKDIIPIINRIIKLFSSTAESKSIDFVFTSPKSLIMYFDEEKVETILNNLLNNAFKFTPENGIIEVAVRSCRAAEELESKDTNLVEIAISNTGPHIPEDQLDKIFDRFYQVESNNNTQGTGIGLSLTKDLIELHHGKISVKSKQGKKTTFTILIPTSKENYNSEEIVESKADHKELEEKYLEIELSETEIDTDKTPIRELPKVLIVEDNKEVQNYLRKNLEDKYYVLTAENGKIGFEKTENELPDLIICDVMMPEMDGFEFCHKVKSEITTNHIPVILLTARAAREDKLEGLNTGADAYLSKPFDLEEIFVRIENLIQQRKDLKERYLKEALFGIDRITSHPSEKEHIEKITQIINQNIDNVDYSVDHFAHDIGMSRSQLFLKIKAWTNQTPQEFIRLYRLKKAAELLKEKSQNVTEVAFAVGFKDTSHFTRSFKKQFGKSPKKFINSLS